MGQKHVQTKPKKARKKILKTQRRLQLNNEIIKKIKDSM